MDSYSVQAVLSVKDKGFTSTMSSATGTLAGLDSASQKSSKSVGALGTAFALANKVISGACSVIKNSVQDAVSRVDTLNQYPKIMEQMGFSSDSAEASITKLSDGIQGLPTSLDSIVSSTQNIAILTGDLDLATDTALALNDAFLASGSSTADAERGLNQYVQMLSSGKVDMQSWKTLQETMGYALSETAKELGITSGNTTELYNALQDGSITFDEFNAAIIKCDQASGGFAETASIASEGIATSWENCKTAVVRGVANMIQAWNDAAADNGIPTIQESLQGLQTVIDKTFSVASKVITVFVNNLDTIVAACIPVVAAIASLKVIQSITKLFEKFKTKAQDSVKVLQNWDDNVKRAKQSSQNLESAQKKLNSAQEKCVKAMGNAATAAGKETEAEKKVADATKKYRDAQEKANDATEDGKKASADLEKAKEELEQAEKDLASATEQSTKAQEEYEAEQKNVAQAQSMVVDCENEQATAMENVSTKAILQSAMMNVLSGEMNIAQAAMEAFNAACEANPLGVVFAAVTAVVSAMSALKSALKKAGIMAESANDKWKDLKDTMDDMYDTLEESDKEFSTNIDNLKKDKANVEQLWAQVKTLASYEDLSVEQTGRLNDYIYQLNDAVPGLGLAIDDATGSLNKGVDAVDAYINAWEALDELSVITEVYNEALENQRMVEEELKYAQDQYNESLEATSGLGKVLVNTSVMDMIALANEKGAVEDLSEEEQMRTAIAEDLASQREATAAEASQALAEAYNNEVQALKDAVEQDTISYEQLSEANQQTVDDMQSSINDLVDTMADGTEAINTDLGVTRDQYLQTMEDNQKAVEDWGNNMESLRNRMEGLGLDTAILDQWAEVPEDGIPLAAEFVNASDEELAKLAGLAESDVETAATSSLQAWGAATDDIPDSIREYITDPTEETIGEQLREIDWSEPTEDLMEELWDSMAASFDNLSLDDIGVSIVDGVAYGMKDMTAMENATDEWAQKFSWFAERDFKIGSPSKLTEEYGEDLGEGLAVGLRKTSTVENAVKRVCRTVEQAFNGLGSSTSSGINKMTSVFKSGMSTMQSASSTGMSAIKSVINSGMTSISTTVTSGMTKAKTAMTSGMNGMKSSVTSGMNSIKTSITTAMNSMTTSVSNGVSKMNNAMRSGMNSVTTTARSAANSIVSQFDGLYNSLHFAGVHAMNGLMAGLISRKGAVMNTAQSIANSVTNTINSALQVGSPSKVLKKTGQYAGEGFVLGLKDMLGDVKDMAGEMADAVNTMVFGAFDSPKLAFAGGVDLNANYAFDNEDMLGALNDIKTALDDDREFNFTIPFTMDGREFARASASYTQDRQDKLQGRAVRRDKFTTGE